MMFLKSTYSKLFVQGAVLLLAACGGSGSSPSGGPQQPSFESPEGLWAGTLSNGQRLEGLIDLNQRGWFAVYDDETLTGLIVAEIDRSDAAGLTAEGVYANGVAGGGETQRIVGSFEAVSARDRLAGTLRTDADSPGLVDYVVDFDARYDQTTAPAVAVGAFAGQALVVREPLGEAMSAYDLGQLEVTVTAERAVIGRVTGHAEALADIDCEFTGTWTPEAAGNVYYIFAQFMRPTVESACPLHDQILYGMMVMDVEGDAQQWVLTNPVTGFHLAAHVLR